VDELMHKPVTSLDDAAWVIAYQIHAQTQKGSMRFMDITYRDTKMSSRFARYFKQILSQKITEKGGITLTRDRADLIIMSSYWEQTKPAGIKYFALLSETSSGKVVSSAQVSIPSAVIKASGYEITPQNFKEAYADKKVFDKDEVKGGGLSVEAWTDRGDDGIALARGEIIKLYVRVNQPAYIRFIYHLANGKRALLLDNYYIDTSKVNMVYEVPEEFECVPPFGAETMQICSSTQKFPGLITEQEDGYELIKESLQSAIVKTRGLKKVSSEKIAYDEKRIVITRMDK
jgi:hypothetical protein